MQISTSDRDSTIRRNGAHSLILIPSHQARDHGRPEESRDIPSRQARNHDRPGRGASVEGIYRPALDASRLDRPDRGASRSGLSRFLATLGMTA